jgi:predicted nucleic acid-binding protein
MPTTSRIYWDTSCFISLLNASEASRAAVCKDVLKHAQAGALEIWTSTLAIAEVIRPKKKYEPKALPLWSEALMQTDKSGALIYPDAQIELKTIWHYYHRHTVPSLRLDPIIVKQIKRMFAWEYIHLIQVTPAIAQHASDLSRDVGLKPADAIHAASALARKCTVLQRFDRHFDKVSHLISVSEPVMLTEAPPLFKGIGAG